MERSDTSLYCDCWHSLRVFFRSLKDDDDVSICDYAYAVAVLSVMDDIEKDIFPY